MSRVARLGCIGLTFIAACGAEAPVGFDLVAIPVFYDCEYSDASNKSAGCECTYLTSPQVRVRASILDVQGTDGASSWRGRTSNSEAGDASRDLRPGLESHLLFATDDRRLHLLSRARFGQISSFSASHSRGASTVRATAVLLEPRMVTGIASDWLFAQSSLPSVEQVLTGAASCPAALNVTRTTLPPTEVPREAAPTPIDPLPLCHCDEIEVIGWRDDGTAEVTTCYKRGEPEPRVRASYDERGLPTRIDERIDPIGAPIEVFLGPETCGGELTSRFIHPKRRALVMTWGADGLVPSGFATEYDGVRYGPVYEPGPGLAFRLGNTFAGKPVGNWYAVDERGRTTLTEYRDGSTPPTESVLKEVPDAAPR